MSFPDEVMFCVRTSYRATPEEIRNFRFTRAEVERRLQNNEPVYVRFKHDDRREGAVGRVSSIKFEESTHKSYYGGDYTDLRADEIEIIWDGRRNKVKARNHEVVWLPNHPKDVGTIWAWNPPEPKEKEPAKVVKDNLGEPIEAGDFIAFVHRKYGYITLRFGTVTRMTPKGTVFVKTLKLKDGDRSEEVRCLDNELVLVSNKLMSRLVMARMAAE